MNTDSLGREIQGKAELAPIVLAGTPPKGRTSKNLPKAVVFEIITAYEAGRPLKEIAGRYGVSRQCIANIASRRGLTLRKHTRLLNDQDIANAYLRGRPIASIAGRFGCTVGCVYYALKRAGVKLTRKQRKET